MIGAKRVDPPLAQAGAKPFAIFVLANWRSTFETRIAVRNLLGGKKEVVRTGLHGYRGSCLPRPEQHRKGIRGGQVNDMRRATVLRGKSKQQLNRIVLALPWPRGKIAGIASRVGSLCGNLTHQLGVRQQRQTGG